MASHFTRTRVMAAVGAAVLATSALVGCTAPAQTGDGEPSTVRWSTNTFTMNQVVIYVAMGIGSFDDHGLEVEYVAAQSSPAAMMTGSTDIMVGRPSDPLNLIKEGEDIRIIAANAINTPAGLLGNNKIGSIEDLAALGENCRIASLPSGNVPLLTAHWAEKYDLQCKIDIVSDYNTSVQATVSGAFDASYQNATTVGQVISDGDARWLLDPLDPDFVADGNWLPTPLISQNMAVTGEYAEAHLEDIQKFLAALADAEEWMQSATNEEIAQAIIDSGVDYWEPQPIDEIVAQMTANGIADNVFQVAGGGITSIDEGLWNDNLKYAAQQGVDIDPDDAKYSYDTVYLAEAWSD
jgi:ABC-type nitrate/sulfonate/bicarbonate transport system substrate-binding protein